VDDYLIASAANVVRKVAEPDRDVGIPNPLITGPGDRCFQPYFTIDRSPDADCYRVWYGAYRQDRKVGRSHLAYMESDDGIRWGRPPRICHTPEIQYGSEVIDEGPDWPDPATRYRYCYWLGGGTRIAVSPDGHHWRPLVDGVVLPHDHDISNIWWDPLREHYLATISTHMASDRWSGRRRTTMQSTSHDLLSWTPPCYVLYADPSRGDEGDTQFYAMNAYLVRGTLTLGMAKVLRDDLVAEGVEPGAFGRAHTSLAWTRDGRHWERDLTPYFEPDPDPRAWDHAHAWIDEQMIVGQKTRLYYCGYRQGHKANRFDERQIGLVSIPRDRYVSRMPHEGSTGQIETVPLELSESTAGLSINAIASAGCVRAAVSDVHGPPLPGLSLDDCKPATGDSLDLPLLWGTEADTRAKFAALRGRRLQLTFQLSNAELFAFDFITRDPPKN